MLLLLRAASRYLCNGVKDRMLVFCLVFGLVLICAKSFFLFSLFSPPKSFGFGVSVFRAAAEVENFKDWEGRAKCCPNTVQERWERVSRVTLELLPGMCLKSGRSPQTFTQLM